MIDEQTIMQKSILSRLSYEQRIVVESDKNLLVKACPGSGKTRTLTHKLAYNHYKYPSSIKKMVAITYTNRAANEISERLDDMNITERNIWVGTIHQFCMEYIIRPYQMYEQRLAKGFGIVDEYVQNKYLMEILKELGIELKYFEIAKIKTNYDVNMNLVERKYIDVVKKYHELLIDKKEIDFDLILTLSYKLLINNEFVRNNIANIINTIFVDEYQDTNLFQYKILGLLTKANKKINMLVVGDVNQAIYSSMGGVAKTKGELEELFGLEFEEKSLSGCYRSTQRIIDYYSYFQVNQLKIDSKYKDKEDTGCIQYITNINKSQIYAEIANIVERQIRMGTEAKDICVIAPQWEFLYPLTSNLKKLVPNIEFDAPELSAIKYDNINVFCNIAKLAFTKVGVRIKMRQKVAGEVLREIRDDYRMSISGDVDEYILLKVIASVKPDSADAVEYLDKVITEVFGNLHISLVDNVQLKEEYENFNKKIMERITRHSLPRDIDSFKKCFSEKTGVVITSCHKIKGEEYTTVIAFGLLEGKVPHWENIFNSTDDGISDAKRLLYVICSRARKNIFLISENERYTEKGREYQPTKVLSTYQYKYDT